MVARAQFFFVTSGGKKNGPGGADDRLYNVFRYEKKPLDSFSTGPNEILFSRLDQNGGMPRARVIIEYTTLRGVDDDGLSTMT